MMHNKYTLLDLLNNDIPEDIVNSYLLEWRLESRDQLVEVFNSILPHKVDDCLKENLRQDFDIIFKELDLNDSNAHQENNELNDLLQFSINPEFLPELRDRFNNSFQPHSFDEINNNAHVEDNSPFLKDAFQIKLEEQHNPYNYSRALKENVQLSAILVVLFTTLGISFYSFFAPRFNSGSEPDIVYNSAKDSVYLTNHGSSDSLLNEQKVNPSKSMNPDSLNSITGASESAEEASRKWLIEEIERFKNSEETILVTYNENDTIQTFLRNHTYSEININAIQKLSVYAVYSRGDGENDKLFTQLMLNKNLLRYYEIFLRLDKSEYQVAYNVTDLIINDFAKYSKYIKNLGDLSNTDQIRSSTIRIRFCLSILLGIKRNEIEANAKKWYAAGLINKKDFEKMVLIARN